MIGDLREELNDYSSDKVDGTDTSGAFTNRYLLRKINEAQSYIYSVILRKNKDAFLESATLTASSSVLTLPWDMGIVKVLLTDNGTRCVRIDSDEQKVTGASGDPSLYVRKGYTIVIDKDGVSDDYTLWYYRRCRDLTHGKAAAEDTLSTDASPYADFYNGMEIEDITGSQSGTISDYTAARVITSTITIANESYYGMISTLPKEFHMLIPLWAALKSKSHPASLSKPSKEEIDSFNAEFVQALNAYATTYEDTLVESIFQDLEPTTPIIYGIR